MEPRRLLSVVVPAYRQERTIAEDLQNIDRVLSERLNGCEHEILCVVDGEVDNTLQRAGAVSSPRVRTVGYTQNRGKGYAVRYGMARARGQLIAFIDAGMEIDPFSLVGMVAEMGKADADIVVGSKRHPASRVRYPLLRRILSSGYYVGARVLFGVKVTDTQCGVKLFRREAVKAMLPNLVVDRYAMDIEMLAAAKALGFGRIAEAPVSLTFERSASAVSGKVVWQMLLDTLRVFYRMRVRHADYRTGTGEDDTRKERRW